MTPEHPSEREPCRRGLAHAGGDRGTTYIELLISLVLIGTAVIALLTAVRATTIATRIDEEQTFALSALLTAASEIEHPPISLPPCPSASDYTAMLTQPSLLPGDGVTATEVARLARVDVDGTPDSNQPLRWSPAVTCDGAAGTSHRITLEYRLDTELVEVFETVKRD